MCNHIVRRAKKESATVASISNSIIQEEAGKYDINGNINRSCTRNRHVLITGGNQGIGFHTALLLAAKGGYDITLACRNKERAEKAVQQIRENAREKNIRIGWLQLDLASLRSVQQLVEKIHRENIVFDVLVLNAGILLPKETKTEDGLEPCFQVNFLGHFLLCEGIIAHQKPSNNKPLRIVSLTSVLHRLVGAVFPVEKDIQKWPRMFSEARRWKAYALSKFATALLAQYLNDMPNVSAVAVHPGNVRTQMAEGIGMARTRKFLFFLKRIMIEPEVAAENVVFCIEKPLGPLEYRHASKTQKLSPAVCKKQNVNNLVQMSRKLTEKFRYSTGI